MYSIHPQSRKVQWTPQNRAVAILQRYRVEQDYQRGIVLLDWTLTGALSRLPSVQLVQILLFVGGKRSAYFVFDHGMRNLFLSLTIVDVASWEIA